MIRCEFVAQETCAVAQSAREIRNKINLRSPSSGGKTVWPSSASCRLKSPEKRSSPFSCCGMSSALLELFRLLSFEPSVSPLVSLEVSSSLIFDLSGTRSVWPEYMNELPRRFSCVSSEGVVSKRAATDVSVSRSPTVYVMVGTIGAGPKRRRRRKMLLINIKEQRKKNRIVAFRRQEKLVERVLGLGNGSATVLNSRMKKSSLHA